MANMFSLPQTPLRKYNWLRLLALPLAFFLVLTPASTYAAEKVKGTTKPLLWQIERDPPAYLFGTIHLPDKRVHALPDVVFEALDGVDALYTELKLDSMVTLKLQNAVMLPGNKTLKDMLPRDVYERTARYTEAKGYDLSMFSKLKVWYVTAQLGLLDYLGEFATTPALDKLLYDRAEAAGKRLGALETIEQQVEALEILDDKEQVEMLKDTLDYLEAGLKSGEDPVQELVRAYLSGDPEKLVEVEQKYLDLNNPIHKKWLNALITVRNKRMAEHIDQLLKKHKTKSFMFAVGALHYPGDDGLLKLLDAEGYKIRRLTADDAGKLPTADKAEKKPKEAEPAEVSP